MMTNIMISMSIYLYMYIYFKATSGTVYDYTVRFLMCLTTNRVRALCFYTSCVCMAWYASGRGIRLVLSSE